MNEQQFQILLEYLTNLSAQLQSIQETLLEIRNNGL